MRKHTPGPWKAHDNEEHGYSIEAGQNGIIAEFLDEGDACLIAEAPNMLKTLRLAQFAFGFGSSATLEQQQEAAEAITAAIAKVEGAS